MMISSIGMSVNLTVVTVVQKRTEHGLIPCSAKIVSAYKITLFEIAVFLLHM